MANKLVTFGEVMLRLFHRASILLVVVIVAVIVIVIVIVWQGVIQLRAMKKLLISRLMLSRRLSILRGRILIFLSHLHLRSARHHFAVTDVHLLLCHHRRHRRAPSPRLFPRHRRSHGRLSAGHMMTLMLLRMFPLSFAVLIAHGAIHQVPRLLANVPLLFAVTSALFSVVPMLTHLRAMRKLPISQLMLSRLLSILRGRILICLSHLLPQRTAARRSLRQFLLVSLLVRSVI